MLNKVNINNQMKICKEKWKPIINKIKTLITKLNIV